MVKIRTESVVVMDSLVFTWFYSSWANFGCVCRGPNPTHSITENKWPQMGKLFKQLKMSQSEELSSASHQVLIKENTKLEEDWGVHCWYIHVHVEVKLSFNFRHSSILWVSAVHRHMILVYKAMKLIEATVLQQLDRSSEAQQHPTCTTDALYKRVPPSGFVIGNLWADISVVNLAPAVNCWHQCLLIGLRKTASVHYNLLNGYC